MKVFAMFLALIALSANVFAEKVNSKESLRICKGAVEGKIPEGTTYKFKRNTATSVDSDRYTHWINLVQKNESGKSTQKLLCETSRSGEILVLEMKPGRWKI